MIKKLGVKYRISCSIGAVIFGVIGAVIFGVAVGADDDQVWIGLGAALFWGFAVWFISLAVRQSNIRDVLDYCKKKPHPEYEMERIEQFYKAGASVCGLRLNNEFFLYIKGDTVNFAETRELMWVFKIVTQNRFYGIKVGKSYQIEVKLNDGSGMALPMKNEKMCDDVIAYIEKMVPYIILGYNDELNSLYNKNPQELERIVDERRHQYFEQVPVR